MVIVVAKFRHNGLRYDQFGWKDANNQLLPPAATLEFVPVTEGSEENLAFWKYTPSGKLELGTVNRDVVKNLDLGKDYYVYITDQKMVPMIDPDKTAQMAPKERPRPLT